MALGRGMTALAMLAFALIAALCATQVDLFADRARRHRERFCGFVASGQMSKAAEMLPPDVAPDFMRFAEFEPTGCTLGPTWDCPTTGPLKGAWTCEPVVMHYKDGGHTMLEFVYQEPFPTKWRHARLVSVPIGPD